METTEKIVESYCRYIRNWFTIPNIKCQGQYEVDLLAVDTSGSEIRRYHIECGVSISGSYSKLTTKAFSTEDLKDRVKAAGQRRTLDYFIHRKFNVPEVLAELKRYGFEQGNYSRIIVTWDATADAREKAKENGIEIWDLPDLLNRIANEHLQHRKYFVDDTARTIQLYAMAMKGMGIK
jgi:hypothetical protein